MGSVFRNVSIAVAAKQRRDRQSSTRRATAPEAPKASTYRGKPEVKRSEDGAEVLNVHWRDGGLTVDFEIHAIRVGFLRRRTMWQADAVDTEPMPGCSPRLYTTTYPSLEEAIQGCLASHDGPRARSPATRRASA
jgi:hypothetical protein